MNRSTGKMGPADVPEDDGEELPSKSERKRTATAAQQLGEQLIALESAELDALGLPERLRDAIDEARRLTSRTALVRQRQFIGKLMRQIDTAPIRAALAARGEKAALEGQRFRRVEAWRDRLLAEGAPAFEELAGWYPGAREAEFVRKVEAARQERARTGASGPAARELFRAVRALLEAAQS